MIAEVLEAKNLYKAAQQVLRNKGASGVDGMPVSELTQYIRVNREQISTTIYSNGYIPQA
ncbi:group II intron reverse transcriptase/maturase, partial [Bizionia gelidisalsuginis]